MTEDLWATLKTIGDKELTQQFAEYLSTDNTKEKSALDWLHLIRKKNESK